MIIMKTRLRLSAGILCLCLALAMGSSAWAERVKMLTLDEALTTALEHNTSYALFLWEQEVGLAKDALKKHPKISTELRPAGVEDGAWQGPQGSLTIAVPLGGSVSLDGRLSVAVDAQSVAVKPTGSLTLGYDLFALPGQESLEPSPEESMRRQVNSLVLQVLELLVDLRKAMDIKEYEEAVLQYLEAQLKAARQTPNYDDLELRRKLRDQISVVAARSEEVDHLQLQLRMVLGVETEEFYQPVLAVHLFEQEFFEEELEPELFAASPELRRARGELERAQTELELERKTMGWKVKVAGGLTVGDGVGWNVGLTASKDLYPRQTILNELELAVAKAEHALELQESALRGELRGALQAIKAAQNQVQLLAELLEEAQEDLALRQRQHEAGLATELQVEEASLAVQKAQMEYFHGELNYARGAAALWNLCGRQLQEMIFAVIS